MDVGHQVPHGGPEDLGLLGADEGRVPEGFEHHEAVHAAPGVEEERPRTRGAGRSARWSWAWVALSSVAVAAYFVQQYAHGTLAQLAAQGVGLAPAYADRSWPVHAAFYAHIGSSGLALLVGPFQFVRRVRSRLPAVHRWVGRVYVVGVLVGAASGLVMSTVSSVALLGFFGFGSLAVLWGWTTWRGYRAAREREWPAHRAWMIRSFALTYAAVTLRLWFGVLVLVQLPFGAGDIDAILDTAYAPVPFLCWLPNLVVAEYLIHRRGLPGFRLVTAVEHGAAAVGRPARGH